MNKPGVCITGAHGFSGSYISNYLFLEEYPLWYVHNSSHIDLCEPIPFQLKGADVLIHTAYRSPDSNVTLDDLAKNILSTRSIIQWCKREKFKYIIFFSSTSLYGEVDGGILNLHSPVKNPDVYGMTKYISEKLFEESGITTTSIRLPLIIGNGSKRNWISRLNAQAEAGEPITIYNPEAMFNNVAHIDYLCCYVEALISKFYNGESVPKTCLIGSHTPITIGSVVDIVVRDRVPITVKETLANPHIISMQGEFAVRPWSTQRTLDKYAQDSFGVL